MTRQCKVCSSIYLNEVNGLLEQNKSFIEIAKICQDKGFIVSASTINRHARLHTDYKFKTSVFKSINSEEINTKNSVDMNIDYKNFLSEYNLKIEDFDMNTIEDFFKMQKNFFKLNSFLLMKIYAITNHHLDLSLKGTVNFPIEKIKSLGIIFGLNNQINSFIKDYDQIKFNKYYAFKLFENLLKDFELLKGDCNIETLESYNLLKDVLDKIQTDYAIIDDYSMSDFEEKYKYIKK